MVSNLGDLPIVESLIIIISVCVLWTETFMQDWCSVIIFISVVTLSHYVLKFPVYVAFGLAGILASLSNIVKRKRAVKENYSENKDEEDDDEDDDEEEDKSEMKESSVPSLELLTKSNALDKTSTLMNTIKNMDPKTITEMTEDTNKLLSSQSELMKTITELTPVIEKGMKLMDKFKGDGKTEELFQKMAKMSKK